MEEENERSYKNFINVQLGPAFISSEDPAVMHCVGLKLVAVKGKKWDVEIHGTQTYEDGNPRIIGRLWRRKAEKGPAMGGYLGDTRLSAWKHSKYKPGNKLWGWLSVSQELDANGKPIPPKRRDAEPGANDAPDVADIKADDDLPF